MRTIYVIPNYECNLNCIHCDLHEKQVEFKHDDFFRQLNSFSNTDNVILFGGEPTFYNNRFIECLETGKVKSISTNLVECTIEQIERMLTCNIATSWNKFRFTNEQYEKWIRNLKILAQFNKKCTVIITLTNDLIQDSFYQNFLKILADIDKTTAVDKILFEHLVDFNDNLEEHHKQCDRWLCKLHYDWNFSFLNEIETKLKKWFFDCSNTYTLQPNGILKKHCPQYERQFFVEKCLNCNLQQQCKPCKLQKYCTFPIELNNLLK